MSDGTRTNVWDSQNRLVSCTKGGVTSTYTYGADGLRRTSTVNGVTTYYVYDGQTLIREMQQNAQGVLQSTATYLCGPRGPEYRRDDTQAEGTYSDSTGTHPAGKTRWYVYDGLGSVVGEVDPSGNLTSSGTFDVYGAKRQGGTGAATSRQGFVGALGHVSDSETGLVYMRARYYDPSTGRFVSQDPAGSGTNWFCYADNNPINEVDPTGRAGKTIDVETGLWLYEVLYAAGESYDNVGSLIGKPYSAAIDWIEKKIIKMESGAAAEEEAAGIELGTGEQEKSAGDDLEGDATTLGGGLSAEDAAKKEVAVIELGAIANFLVATDDYTP